MLVIREKTNNLNILAWGYVQQGGLGEFDTSIYEEIELENLPEGWVKVKEKPIAQGKDLVSFIEIQLANSLGDFGGIEMMSKLKVVRDFLLSSASNPITQERLNNCLLYIQQNKIAMGITDAELQSIGTLVNVWKQGVRFE